MPGPSEEQDEKAISAIIIHCSKVHPPKLSICMFTSLEWFRRITCFDLCSVGICDPKPPERSGEEEFKEPRRQGLELWLLEKAERW